MGHLHSISFDEQSDTIKDSVEAYWTKRADSFYDLKHEEALSYKAELWLKEVLPALPEGECLHILDVGCGAGFFEAVLGKLGHKITGIDLTEEMVGKVGVMIQACNLDADKVSAHVMDAEKLDFEDESFDVVISRNVTWTLPHPIDAYQEWHRVLKKGGVLLNYDAEYAKGAHDERLPENLAHRGVTDEMKEECHRIYHMLTISSLPRPEWDMEVLRTIGFAKASYDSGFGDRVYSEHDQFYMPERMFAIKAVK